MNYRILILLMSSSYLSLFAMEDQKSDVLALVRNRREELCRSVREQYPTLYQKKSAIVLYGGLEESRTKFRQESNLYYASRITEPGVILVVDLDQAAKTTLYIPQYIDRSKWVVCDLDAIKKDPASKGLDAVKFLGNKLSGYSSIEAFAPDEAYENFGAEMKKLQSAGATIFTAFNKNSSREFAQQKFLHQRLFGNPVPTHDIEPLIARLRRKKDSSELAALRKAIAISSDAHRAIMKVVVPGMSEADVQTIAEGKMTQHNALPAYQSIVGAGLNATILHYTENKGKLEAGDLLLVDAAAEADYYCADITRTYPISGSFTPRQKEIYNLVLKTQAYIASIAKPGIWLSHKERPEQSLSYLAKKFLNDHGYGNYFTHGIGHFLGLDVHDAGDYKIPLQEGDVFTIEPGIYIPEEKIGIRIEDDYLMGEGGVICLSDGLPKEADEIEALIKKGT